MMLGFAELAAHRTSVRRSSLPSLETCRADRTVGATILEPHDLIARLVAVVVCNGQLARALRRPSGGSRG